MTNHKKIECASMDPLGGIKVKMFRRVEQDDSSRFLTELSDKLKSDAGIDVRLPGGTRWPSLMVLNSIEGITHAELNDDNTKAIKETITTRQPGLLKKIGVTFDTLWNDRPKNGRDAYLVARPCYEDRRRLISGRILAAQALEFTGLKFEENNHWRPNCPDLTVVYAGRSATMQAIEKAQKAVSEYLPVTVNFSAADFSFVPVMPRA